MNPRVIAYKPTSTAGRLLAQSLNCPRVRSDGDYTYNPNHLVVNLGFSGQPVWNNANVRWLNNPRSVAIAVCKKKTFLKLREANVSIPEFTEDRAVAARWIREGSKVACREILNGHSAAGLVIAETEAQLSPRTQLYVKYFPKKHEYRVHMIRDRDGVKIFDYIQKKVRSDLPEGTEVNYQIRNHGQWIFAREGVTLPDCVKVESIKAMNALGLDLASVDICYNETNRNCVVLELNSCSSLGDNLESTTLRNYTRVITDVLNNRVVPAITPVPAIPAAVVAPQAARVAPAPPAPVAPPPVVRAAPAPAPEPVRVAVPPPVQPRAVAAPVNNNANNHRTFEFPDVSNLRVTKMGKKFVVSGIVQVGGRNRRVQMLEIDDSEVVNSWEE